MESAIRCHGLKKTYPGRVEAVRGIDLVIPRGECFGLLGPNGAGKTTTIEMLEGLLAPSEGDIEVLGGRWGRDDETIRQRLGVSLQDTRLSEKLTVEETLRIFQSFYTRHRDLETLLAEIGLTEKRSSWVQKLSGGQKQRLAVATALVGDPELLFLDEPTTGLDPQSRRNLWDLIRAFRERGGSVLLTTHYMEEAERLCDRVAIVDQGQIIALGAPRELIARLGGDHVLEVRVDDAERLSLDELSSLPRIRGAHRDAGTFTLATSEVHVALPALLEHLRARGLVLEHLGTHHASLEDVFVSITGRHFATDDPMRARPFTQLLLARVKEPLREPEVVFWVFIFPVLLAVGLGIAFRNRPPEEIAVGVVSGDRSPEVIAALDSDSEIKAELIDEDEAASRIRLGHVDLLIVPGKTMTYRFDPTRPASLVARARVDDTLQRALGRLDVIEVVEEHVTEPGARYIDFLIPGLIGLNLMSGGLWGVGFAVVDMRTRKLLKRLVASPMRKSEFIGAMMTSRLVFMLFEVVLLLVAGHLIFDVALRGSILATILIGVVGALAFGAIGILVASRAERIETVSGLMNLVMLPMFVFSGVFFSSDRFPEAIQPFVQALPLTMLNDALRSVIIEGASLGSQLSELAGLVVWGSVSFLLAMRWFRWS